jgi:hypothetical protein
VKVNQVRKALTALKTRCRGDARSQATSHMGQDTSIVFTKEPRYASDVRRHTIVGLVCVRLEECKGVNHQAP